MSENMNFLLQKENETNKLEQKNVNEAPLDFFLLSETDIHILNENHEKIDTITSAKDTILGKALMRKYALNVMGDVKKFSYIKIDGANGSHILPIDSNMLKDWSYRTTDESNKAPVLKIQTNKDGEGVSYVVHNSNLKVFKHEKKKLE